MERDAVIAADRLWQSFLRLKSTREARVCDVERLGRWYWLRYYLRREGLL